MRSLSSPSLQHRRTRRLTPVPIALTALVLAAACDDPSRPVAPPTPDGPSPALLAAAKVTGSITAIEGFSTFVIDGPSTIGTVSVTNASNTTLKDVVVVARITQAGASRDAGSAAVTCPNSTPGLLPKGATCSVQLPVAASNIATGSGTLVAGTATLETSLVQNGGRRATVLDSRSDAITLSTGSGSGGGDPTISNLVLSGSELTIDGTGVNYTITIDNPGAQLTGVVVQAEISQGAASRAAGGVVVMCPNLDGILPPGSCTFGWHASASNATGGTGTLVPGAATLRIYVAQSTEFDSRTFDVTLLAKTPTEPYIVSVSPNPMTLVIGGTAANASILLRNPTQATFSMVVLHATIRQGTTFRNAGDNNHLMCGGRRGELPPGDCNESLSILASNANSGSGDLQPGDAVLEIEMTSSGTRLDLVTVPVTLVFQ